MLTLRTGDSTLQSNLANAWLELFIATWGRLPSSAVNSAATHNVPSDG